MRIESTQPTRRRCLRWLGAAAAATAVPQALSATPLERVRERGVLTVGLYQDMPPFNVNGAGIDVELARALAESLSLRLAPLPFHANENMGDDLRNMVWRGHYLGYGPADVLLHVPVDRPLIEASPQVTIFAPYWRERVVIARRIDALPRLDTLAPLANQPLAVAGQSLAGWLLIGADGGAYRDRLDSRCRDGVDAARALQRGEVVAAAGLASEVESVLRGDPRFVITPLPVPRAPKDGWAVGMAVRRDSTELALALQQAMNGITTSGRLQQIFARANVAWQAV
jgi:ABC-type amino acid transport substrate-binding protein